MPRFKQLPEADLISLVTSHYPLAHVARREGQYQVKAGLEALSGLCGTRREAWECAARLIVEGQVLVDT